MLKDNEIESLERNRYRCPECVKLTQETFTKILESLKTGNALKKEHDVEREHWRGAHVSITDEMLGCQDALESARDQISRYREEIQHLTATKNLLQGEGGGA